MLLKIKTLIKIIIKSKFQFKNPKKRDLVIFDNETFELLEPLCNKYDFFVLKNRYYQIKELYISFKILFYILKNFNRGNFSTIYFSAVISQIDPKLVLTIIDNSDYFSNVAKILHNKYKFVAIQGAARYEIKQFKKKFFIPEFYCFGDYEEDLYKKNNSKINSFISCGSLKQSYYLKSDEFKNDNSKKYDIALLSEPCPGWSEKFPLFEETVGKIAQFVLRLVKKNNLKLIFVGKRAENSILREKEISFYKRYLNENFFINPRLKEKFSSYKYTESSELVIGFVSTLLRENLGAGKKILSCNFTNDERHDFPIDGICNLKDDTYESFEKRVLEIINSSKENYFEKLNKDKNYVMRFDPKNTAYDIIENKLNQYLN